jgi:hypothetical protein
MQWRKSGPPGQPARRKDRNVDGRSRTRAGHRGRSAPPHRLSASLPTASPPFSGQTRSPSSQLGCSSERRVNAAIMSPARTVCGSTRCAAWSAGRRSMPRARGMAPGTPSPRSGARGPHRPPGPHSALGPAPPGPGGTTTGWPSSNRPVRVVAPAGAVERVKRWRTFCSTIEAR